MEVEDYTIVMTLEKMMGEEEGKGGRELEDTGISFLPLPLFFQCYHYSIIL